MFDASALEGYTPEQAAYIKRYAGGLLVSWTKEHIDNLISPDVGDGFHAPEGVFTSEEQEWDAHSEVCNVLDTWMDGLLAYLGFNPGDNVQLVAEKYPTVPEGECGA